MTDRIKSAFAFVSDIHGNHIAFEAVLEDIRSVRASIESERFELVCLGDSFDGGPDPLQVFQTLKGLNCVHLRGNHEDYLIDCLFNPKAEKYSRPLWRFVPWTLSQMGQALWDVQKTSSERWRCDDWNLNAVHAGISNNNRVPDFFTQQAKLSAEFVGEHRVSAKQNNIFFNGHSHYLGRHIHPINQENWFNCGSVGYPFVEKIQHLPEAPLATWVWVECRTIDDIRILNRRVPYSSDLLLRRYVESGALELCAPFSFALLAQSLFNVDVVYPFFQQVKKQNLTPHEMARVLITELERQSVFQRINALLGKAGLREIKYDL